MSHSYTTVDQVSTVIGDTVVRTMVGHSKVIYIPTQIVVQGVWVLGVVRGEIKDP